MNLNVISLCFISLLPAALSAQSLSLSVTGGTSGNTPDQFMLNGHQINLQANTVEFMNSGTAKNVFLTYGVSPDHSLVAFLESGPEQSRINLMGTGGSRLHAFDAITAASGDPSLAVYPFNDGSVLVRDNIAGFTLFDSFGKRVAGVSGSGDSNRGELISEVSMDPNGKTVVIYTPKIKQQDGMMGSRAQLFTAENQLTNIFSSNTRTLRSVSVSSDGQFIALVTGGQNARDRVLVMDRYGNRLNTIETEEQLVGARIAANPSYLLLYSSGRAMVFNTLSGERIGSSSFSSGLLVADYFSEDQIILGMTGDYSSAAGIVQNIEFLAIHLGKRAISSEELSGIIGLSSAVQPVLKRTGPGRYRLEGTSKIVEIRTSF
ncbi:MAG: hypothetical protein R3211_11430 [Balneolaceae bacterium]|nr:hypothetical protein [Balneolaceae bacterium]